MESLSFGLKGLLGIVVLAILSFFQPKPHMNIEKGDPEMKAHYVEIVSQAVDNQCKTLEKVHGLSFGPENPHLGGARVANTAEGGMIGVRAPLAEHEQPIVRLYFEVDDIQKAVAAAEAAGDS